MERLDGYLRIQEAAEFLGVSPNTLRNWGRDSKIPEFRHPLNNYRLYRRSDLEAVLRQVRLQGQKAKRQGRPGPDGPMSDTRKNWIPVTESRYPGERDALDFVRDRWPDHEPYRAWAN